MCANEEMSILLTWHPDSKTVHLVRSLASPDGAWILLQDEVCGSSRELSLALSSCTARALQKTIVEFGSTW